MKAVYHDARRIVHQAGRDTATGNGVPLNFALNFAGTPLPVALLFRLVSGG
jgi:hypothetical protein